MNNIISLTGHKHCGKLELGFKLAENTAIEFVKPYTDKPDNDLWCDCYHYVSVERLNELISEREVLYKTKIGKWRYVFFKDQLTAPYNVLILDDYGVAQLKPDYDKYMYTVKVCSVNEKPSKRVGVYLYDHEFDEVFEFDTDAVEELEWRIEENLPLQ